MPGVERAQPHRVPARESSRRQGCRLPPALDQDVIDPPSGGAPEADRGVVPTPSIVVESQPIMGRRVEAVLDEVDPANKRGQLIAAQDDHHFLMVRAQQRAGVIDQDASG